VVVYGLHGGEPENLVADFVAQTGVTFPVMFGQFSITAFAFPSVGYPFPRQVVIGKDRTIRSLRNDLDIPSLRAEVVRLLGE
jgi:hypothetical protein